MKFIKKCDFCKKVRLWFLIKQREIKPNEFMPKIKSEKKMCGFCFNKAKKYFIKEGKNQVEEK